MTTHTTHTATTTTTTTAAGAAAIDFLAYEGFRRAGDRGEATVTRDGSVALAGARGAATVGHYGMARTGAYGRAAAGHHSVAVAGVYGNAVAGDGGTAIVGHLGTGAAGAGGALVFSWVDREGSTRRSAVVIDGEKFIPGVMYRCEDDTGEVVPA